MEKQMADRQSSWILTLKFVISTVHPAYYGDIFFQEKNIKTDIMWYLKAKIMATQE